MNQFTFKELETAQFFKLIMLIWFMKPGDVLKKKEILHHLILLVLKTVNLQILLVLLVMKLILGLVTKNFGSGSLTLKLILKSMIMKQKDKMKFGCHRFQ